MSVGAIIVNETRPARLDGSRVTQAELRRGLTAAGLPADRATVAGLAAEVAEYRARLDLERRLRGELDKLDRLMLELPLLPEGIDVSALYSLAETLIKQGVVTA
jgi:hypothetical protein